MAMASQYQSSPLLLVLSSLLLLLPHTSHSQTSFISVSCSERNASDLAASAANIAAVLADMRRNISSSASHFAAAQRNRGPEPVYAVFQCREYLSPADCLACYEAAAARVRRDCPDSDGSTAYYEGCFLRYENDNVYDDNTILGRAGRCDDREVAAVEEGAVNSTALGLMLELVEAVPAIRRYYAAVRRPVGGVGAAAMIYGVAQCVLTLSSGDCRSCLRLAYENIQGCLPAAGATAVDVGCFMRYSDQAFFNESQVVDVDRFIRTGSSKQIKAVVIAAAGAGAGALVLGVLMLVLLLRCRHRRRSKSYVTIAGLSADLRGPASFTFHELKHATGNFSDQNKLGQGGFATVYKGVLRNGKCVAVKKMKLSESAKAKEEFETEMALISNIHHRNLVPLLGCCRKGPDLLFVYEYMKKGSLDQYLFGDKQGTLSWAQRFNIILGTARGLAYLHEEYYVRIIHRDIKSGNILLDENFHPKIADFGLARLLPQDKSHENTKLAGTLGYTAPEYVLSGHLSEKVDVYSFGVVVLETLSGLRSNKVQNEHVTVYLLEWCWRLYERDSLMEMVDKSTDPTEYEEEEVKRVAEIGLMCTQSAALRPPMSEVVAMLLNKEHTRVELTRPAFIRQTDVDANTAPSDNASSKSQATNAVMTFSTFSGRN